MQLQKVKSCGAEGGAIFTLAAVQQNSEKHS